MRQTARYVYLKELEDGRYVEKEGWEPNEVVTGRGIVSRCNVIATLLSMNNQLVLDDGTGQAQLRTFEDVPGLRDSKTGSVVLVIGRPRKYQDELYLVPEVVRSIDPRWAKVRKIQLGEVTEFVDDNPPEQQTTESTEQEENNIPENKVEAVLALIDKLDDGTGAQVQLVIQQSGMGDVAEDIINQLLLDGEIFELKPGVVKVL